MQYTNYESLQYYKGQIWFVTVLLMCAHVHYTTVKFHADMLPFIKVMANYCCGAIFSMESPYRKFFILSEILSHKMIMKIDIKKISLHLV